MPFATVEQAIADIKAGKLIIVADDEDRENEGDLICAAQLVTPELINFMIKRAGGMICLALTPERCDQLDLPQMSEVNTEEQRTAFTVSIDASPRFGVTTGISAQDRAKTIRVAVDAATVPADLCRPGHVHPLRAREGGVLQRFAAEHGLTFITVAQLVAHRLKTERLVHRVAEARLPTDHGEWRIVGYRNDVDHHEHVALVF